MSAYAVILVHSTSHAVQAEKVLSQAGVTVRLVPTPRHLSSDCGAAVRIPVVQSDECRALLEEAGVEIDRIASLNG